MDILFIIGYTALFILIIWKWKWMSDDQISKYIFITLFLAKIAAAIFGGALYEKLYNGGDTYAFFNDSKIISNSFYSDKGDFLQIITGVQDDRLFMEKHGVMTGWNNNDVVYNDSRTIIRLHAIIGLISGGFYNVHAVFFAFLSLLGLMAIFKVARLLTDQHPFLLLAAVCFAPGVMFWCSMASKESILILVMGLFLYHCVRLLTVSKSPGNMAGMFLAGFLFIHIKAYFLVLITPCLLAFTWVHVTNQKYSLLKYGLVYLVFILLFFNMKYLLNGFDPVDVLVMKRLNFESFANATPKDFGSYIELPEFSSDWGDIVTVAPIAAFSVFTRPYVWESSELLFLIAAIENILLFLILITGVRFVRWDRMARNKNLLLFCMCFVISIFILIGLTAPVMGAIVRYKAPVLPFLCLIPLLITGSYNRRKI